MSDADRPAGGAYRAAGVDQDAADALVGVLSRLAGKTRRRRDADDLGSFAGLFPLDEVAGMARPSLAVSTDGVGTKVELLRAAGAHRTAGWDCVAMNVDDVVCAGARPAVFVDYVAIERFDARVVEEIVTGVAEACVEAGCELVGGETAQHPGTMAAGGYDVAGTCIGIVDAEHAWGPHRVHAGDNVVGLASSGLHANGYSLVRRVVADDAAPSGLLEPTAIYAAKLLAAAGDVEVHAAAHVTGGGIPGNLPRALPSGLGATLDRSAWERPAVFDWLAARGVGAADVLSTFNDGLGMLVVTPSPDALVAALADLGVRAWVCGEVTADPGVRLV